MEMTKRIFSFLLALALLIGNIPAVAFAAEESALTVASETVWLEGDSSCYVNNNAYLVLFGTTESEITWTVSDPDVAMIYYSEGTYLLLYGLSVGTVTVTATTESGLTASFEVTFMETPNSGTCGDNLTWNLDDEGTLTISGTGEMTGKPWDSNKSKIKAIVIEEGVTSIYRLAFNGCRYATELAIPASVTSIGQEAFMSCYKLQSFSVASGNTAFCASDGVLFNADMTKLIAYPAAKTGNYTIPATVTTVGYKAFDGATIAQLTIPASVTSLENYAFNGNISFSVDAGNPAFASGSAGELYSKDKTILYRYCSNQSGEAYTVADGVVTIADGAFEGSFSKVVFPDSVQTIGGWAFNGTHIESVTFGTGLKEIGDCAFQSCSALKTIYFTGDAPTFVDIPFNDHVIATAYYPAGNPTWTSDVMQNYDNNGTSIITWVAYDGDIPAETEPEATEPAATSGTCGDNLTWELENGVLTISGTGDMYNYCEDAPWQSYADDIKKVVIEEGVTSIGDYAILCCFNLTDVTIPSTVTTIGTMGFAACTAMGNITLPENLTSIGNDAFVECHSMTELVIPASVTEISAYAFAGCIGLTKITFHGDAPAIGGAAFANVTATAYYPAGNPTWTADVMKDYDGNITWVAYTPGEAQPLEAPVAKISGDAESGKPVVKWNTVEGAVKYRVYRSTQKTSGYKLIYTAKKGRSYTDKDAVAGTNYYYKVKAIHEDSALNSGWSNVVNRMCDLAQPEVSITGSSASGKPIVKWETVTGAAKYRVYRADSEDGDYELIYTGVKARSYTDKTAKAGKTYYYKVKAVHSKSSADSALSDAVSRLCVLAKPVVSITRKNGDPRLTWDKVDGAAKYYIYRATSKDGKYTKIKTTVSATSFTDTTAKAGKTYYYKVKAVHSNTDANSAYSSVKYITAK